MSTLKERFSAISDRIGAAAAKTGRTAADITLVAVTKGVSWEAVCEARETRLRVFGENKVQEASLKIPAVPSEGIEWHMVGHLQTNKVKDAVSLFSLIQSVDSVRLAQKINEVGAQLNRVVPVLLEVNISGESQKYGFSPEEIYAGVEACAEFPFVHIQGLMGMAPENPDEAPKRAAFKTLRNLFSVCKGLKRERLEMKYLSMGMTDDFEIAIEEGSNMVRLGRALFARPGKAAKV